LPIKVGMRDALTGEESAALLDSTNALHRVLPAETDSDLPLLGRIDWYADVQFTSNEVGG
jgi:hypothetical protein